MDKDFLDKVNRERTLTERGQARIICLLVVFGVLFSVLVFCGQFNRALVFADELPGSGGAAFAGGEGTAESPYLIATEGQLDSVRDYLDGYEDEQGNKDYCFRLVADIALTKEWTPIGGMDWEADKENIFGGVFDGGGHTVSGLFIDGGEFSFDIGFFYGLNGAQVKNLTVVTTDEGVRGYKNVGIIAGYMLHSEITGVCVAGKVSGAQQVGGIVGKTVEAPVKITNCLVNAEVVGTESAEVGGVAGRAVGATITYCIVTGNLTGAAATAGGDMTAHYYLGGIIGYGEEINMTRCLFSGKIVGETEDSGGIIGELSGFTGGSQIASVYYDTDKNPLYEGCGNISGYPDFVFPDAGRTAAQLLDTATFVDWDFENTCIVTSDGNIMLRMFYVQNPSAPKKWLIWLYISVAVMAAGITAIVVFVMTKNNRKLSVQNAAKGDSKNETATGVSALPETISPREREVAEQIFEGKTRKQIAAQLFITDGTVKNHIESLLKKTGCASQKELIIKYRIK